MWRQWIGWDGGGAGRAVAFEIQRTLAGDDRITGLAALRRIVPVRLFRFRLRAQFAEDSAMARLLLVSGLRLTFMS
jgi:hypothetical protein